MTSPKKRAALFDLDGTLADTGVPICLSANWALVSCGFPASAPEECLRGVGNGLERLIRLLVPQNIEDAQIRELMDHYQRHHRKHWMQGLKAYPGIEQALDTLANAGFSLGVCTNKPQEFARATVQHLFGADRFQCIVGAREGIAHKPDRSMPDLALASLGVQPQDAVFIGDSIVDWRTSKNTGMRVVLVDWGFKPWEDTQGAPLAQHPNDLAAMVMKVSSG